MFSFQAIHNPHARLVAEVDIVIYQCQCSLFKQFTTHFIIARSSGLLSFISVNVLFSSNSQPNLGGRQREKNCHLSVSMFSFQAIHNSSAVRISLPLLSFISVNVLFSSNSQQGKVFFHQPHNCHLSVSMFSFQAIHNQCGLHVGGPEIVIYQCQCSLFKQFTTITYYMCACGLLSFISVNVLFSSNSQPRVPLFFSRVNCHLSVSMFSFQAIHNAAGCQ